MVEEVQAELTPIVQVVRQTLLGLKQNPELAPSRIVLCGGSWRNYPADCAVAWTSPDIPAGDHYKGARAAYAVPGER